MRHDFYSALKSAIQSIGESNRKTRRKKIDIKLQTPVRIDPVHDQGTPVTVG